MFQQWRVRGLPEPERLFEAEVAVAFPDLTISNASECPAYYLQGIRSGVLERLGPAMVLKYERRYRLVEPKIIEALCAAIKAKGVTDSVVVVPPSSRSDAKPYATALLEQGIATTDLSHRIERIVSTFRAGAALSFADVRSSLRTVGTPDSAPPSSLIVVDDVLTSGRSVAATVLALRESGFICNETRVLVAAAVSTS